MLHIQLNHISNATQVCGKLCHFCYSLFQPAIDLNNFFVTGIIFPMNGKAYWKKHGHEVKPPLIQKLPGRPKMKRRRDGNDDKDKSTKDGAKLLRRVDQTSVRCSLCKQSGHNKRTCKDAHSSTDDLVGATAVQTPTIDNAAVPEDEHHDCILEMDVHEAPVLTQGSQSTQGEANIVWPEVVGTPPQTVWPAWPVVEVQSPFEVGATHVNVVIKGKHTLKGGKGNNNKRLPPTNYNGPSLHGCSSKTHVQQFKTNVGGTEIVSAPFTKKGKLMVTHGALSQALAAAKSKLGEANSDTVVQSVETMHKDGHEDEAGGEDAT